MDPDEALRIIRALIAEARKPGDYVLTDDETEQLVEHVEALDGWLTAGGFLPQPWATARADNRPRGIRGNVVSIAAECQKCGEGFNPSDEDDLEHIARADGTPCGGHGQIVGVVLTQGTRQS